MKPEETQDFTKPVAYDTNGRPLYAHPPQEQATSTAQAAPQVVYMARPLEPASPHISDEVKRKADQSKADFPFLNLSEGEYVISAVKRHPIGLLSIWAVVVFLIVILFVAIGYALDTTNTTSSLITGGGQSLAFIFLVLAVLAFLGGVISTVVYNANRFYLTNESVIQHIQNSLFSRKEQTISLVNIEDASFRQHGFIQTLINYGSLRLSTEGDETTYRFNFVSNPQEQIRLLNNAVEAFKNGRPIDPNETNN